MPRYNIYNEDYIRSNSITNTTGCWEWQQEISNNGYGRVCSTAPDRLAHRLSWLIFRGNIPQFKIVCHTCDNRRCVNPHHLFIGDQRDNMQDAINKGRFVANIQVYNATRTIPDEILSGIISDYLKGGMLQREIASKYGVSLTKVNKTITKYRNAQP